MIIDKLNDLAALNALDRKLQSKLNFLKETDFSEYAAGRHEIDENSYFMVLEYETRELDECFWEAHQQYLDFHYILEGNEKIAFDHIDRQEVKEEYNEGKDATFFEGDVHSIVTMNPGDVMICFPEDSHMTAIKGKEAQKVRKIVLKAKV